MATYDDSEPAIEVIDRHPEEASATVSDPAAPPATLDELAERLEAAASVLMAATEGEQPMRLKVGGTELAPDDWMRAVVMVGGRTVLERTVMELLTEIEMDSRRAAGEDAADWDVTDEEVLATLTQTETDFLVKQPGQDLYALLAERGIDRQAAFVNAKTSMRFDRLFLSPRADGTFPDVTREAIMAQGEQGVKLLEMLQQATTEGGQVQPMILMVLRNQLNKSLREVAIVRTMADGLPTGVCLEVDGRPLRTIDAFADIARTLTPAERFHALQWLVLDTAVRADLEAKDAMLNAEDFAAERERQEAVFRGSLFPIEMVALQLRGFPTMPLYWSYTHLRASYETNVLGEATDEDLARHLASNRDALGQGKLNLSAILLRRADGESDEALLARGQEIVERAKADEAFDALRDEYCEFPERPPAAPGQPPNAAHPDKGRFGAQNRVQLRGMAGENEFAMLLNGTGIVDEMFRTAQRGEVIGPAITDHGCLVFLVHARVPAIKALSLTDERNRDLVRQDYVDTEFRRWASGVLAAAEVEVL